MQKSFGMCIDTVDDDFGSNSVIFFSLWVLTTNDMFAEYIQAALEKAEYEVIDNP